MLSHFFNEEIVIYKKVCRKARTYLCYPTKKPFTFLYTACPHTGRLCRYPSDGTEADRPSTPADPQTQAYFTYRLGRFTPTDFHILYIYINFWQT